MIDVGACMEVRKSSRGTRHGLLTHYNEKADEDGRQRAHAELERAALLDQLAVLAPEPFRAVAAVAGLAVHARAPVAAGEVETLVLVYATLSVARQYQPFTATTYIAYNIVNNINTSIKYSH